MNTTLINRNAPYSPVREIRSDPLGDLLWIGYYDGDSAYLSYRDLNLYYGWIVAIGYRLVQDGLQLGATNGN